MKQYKKLSLIALILLITGAIDSVRNLPATALFGTNLIFFFFFAALVFLVPVALVAAELSSVWPEEEGGVYSWVYHAFGPKLAFITTWLQWINTLVWYPTILSFIASTIAYCFYPELANHSWYLIIVIVLVFWSLTILGMFGVRSSAKFVSRATIIGMIIPMAAMIILGFIWVLTNKPLAIHFNLHNLWPKFNKEGFVSLTAIVTSFLGMELSAAHVRDIENPQKNFPKAMFWSSIFIILTMILGSLAIAVILPKGQINLVNGVMQTFNDFLAQYHLEKIMPLVAFLLLIGSLGGMINWIISPVKGLLLASKHGFLPPKLGALNSHGAPYLVLIMQAIVVTIISSSYFLLPTINAAYWFLTALSTELYMLMYVLMFVAAFVLKKKFIKAPRHFKIPGGNLGYYLACILGLFGCIMTLVIGFFPPEEAINLGFANNYRFLFALGLLGLTMPAFLLCKAFWRNHA